MNATQAEAGNHKITILEEDEINIRIEADVNNPYHSRYVISHPVLYGRNAVLHLIAMLHAALEPEMWV